MDKCFIAQSEPKVTINTDKSVSKEENREDLERAVEAILKNHDFNNKIKLDFGEKK